MRGYAKNFVRVTMKDKTIPHIQGGSNYRIDITEKNGCLIVKACDNHSLINGHNSVEDITIPINNIECVEVDRFDKLNKIPVPVMDITYQRNSGRLTSLSPDRKPIQTAAAKICTE